MPTPPLITEDERAKANHAAITSAAEKAGVNQHYQLPDAVLVGSQEDARILNRFRSGEGNQSKTVEDLLRELVNKSERQIQAIKEWVHKATPIRVYDMSIF